MAWHGKAWDIYKDEMRRIRRSICCCVVLYFEMIRKGRVEEEVTYKY